MKAVYLDQNKWIDLAKVFYRKTGDPGLLEALRVVLIALDRDVVFPLSAVHYIETSKIADRARRERLGAFMWAVSRGRTFVDTERLVRNEVEKALSRRVSRISPRPFRLISTGVGHAFGKKPLSFRVREPLRSALSSDRLKELKRYGRQELERAVIVGKGPGGIMLSRFEHTRYNYDFMQHLDSLPARFSTVPRGRWDDALRGAALSEIHDPVYEALLHHDLSWKWLVSLGKEELSKFVDELPSRRVEMHLYKQLLKNTTIKPRVTDLEDWCALGPAVAYCDVVVCEKHYAELVTRDAFETNAIVISDVRQLPEVI